MHKAEQKREGLPVVDIFSKLGNELRFMILTELGEKNMKTIEILKKTDISVQALHKQIMLLVDSGLVHKHDGKISLTEFGRNIVEQIPSFAFLSEHKEYFQNHTIRDLSPTFLQTIGLLRNCTEIHGAVKVLEKTHSLIHDSEKYLRCLVVQYSIETAHNVIAKIKKSDIFIHYIMGHNTIVPKGREALLKKSGWSSLVKNGTVKNKMVKNLGIMLTMSETKCLVSFPDNKGTISLDSALYSTDKLFHRWCSNLFDEIWNSAHPFDEKKLHE